MLNGFTVVTENPDDSKRIQQIFDEMGAWQVVENAAILKRHHGWSVLVMGEEWVRCHGSHWITPSNDWFADYNSPFFGLPEGWRIQLKSPIGGEVFIEQEDSILFWRIKTISRFTRWSVSNLANHCSASLMQRYNVWGFRMS